MIERHGPSDRLDSWKDIASYLRRNVRTVMRWEEARGLPVHRIPGGGRQAIFAYRSEIDEWLKQRPSDSEGPELSDLEPEAAGGNSADGLGKSDNTNSPLPPWGFSSPRFLVPLVTAVGLLAVTSYAVYSMTFPRRVHFTKMIQLTADGALKDGMATDGRSVYFGELREGKSMVMSVPVGGGAIHAVATPGLDAYPVDVSADGRELLVLERTGHEEERALWIVPTEGGLGSRVGTVLCQAAAWSPDGRMIAFASHKSIYVTKDRGATVDLLQSFDGVPNAMRWSTDGKRIRFGLRDPGTLTCSYGEISLLGRETAEVDSLTPFHIAVGDCGDSPITLDAEDRSFLTAPLSQGNQILLLEKRPSLLGTRYVISPLTGELRAPGGLALDAKTRTLFVTADSVVSHESSSDARVDLFSYRPESHGFRPFLPGVPAKDVDYSPDGQRIVYVREPEHTVWVSRPDGSEARQIPFTATDLELPRWSPDGKWIALMARFVKKPWRIFVLSADGSRVREASIGSDNQGAPTWSPDGNWLSYGNVRCQLSNECAIHKIELASGKQFVVPGSEGLGTARWSPDGHYIAALSPEQHQLLVYDIAHEQWRKLADDISGNDLSWSRDSRFIYASRPLGSHPEVVRIAPKGGALETVVDLESLAKLSGTVETWFALAPDNSVILRRIISAEEVYALSYAR